MSSHSPRTDWALQDFDFFSKLEEEYVSKSRSGGLLTISIIFSLFLLIISECHYYLEPRPEYNFTVDDEPDAPLSIFIDITVKMQCRYVGADLLDASRWSLSDLSDIRKQDVNYENDLRKIYSNTSFLDSSSALLNGCRILAKITARKVAGNFHITAGNTHKGQEHDVFSVPADRINFTHHIHSVVFGTLVSSLSYQLDGSLQVSRAEFGREIFTYFLTVVPTKYIDSRGTVVSTYQFAVREYHRLLDYSKGINGVPGIFFKYDISDLAIIISNPHASFLHFISKLMGIVGGIFATSGILHQMFQSLTDRIFSSSRSPIL